MNNRGEISLADLYKVINFDMTGSTIILKVNGRYPWQIVPSYYLGYDSIDDSY